MKAYLILEDGSVYDGENVGALREAVSEIVFNTSMTGYLEVMTDPSYAGQAVVMTYPLIGNYGICHEDMESDRPWIDGLIVRELSEVASNFRNEDSIQNFLIKNNIPCICGIDTRDLTKRLREHGTMNGFITVDSSFVVEKILQRIKEYSVKDVVKRTSTKETYILPGKGKRVVLIDFGAKKKIARQLQKRGCEVIVVPCDTEVKKLYDTDIPIFAICLGHQLMALATGANTYKLRYGHRGGNHPVKDLETGRTYISSQNHGYAVDESTLDKNICVPAFVNVNDGTNEGLRYINKKIFTVQYHPEACPGPRDSSYLFDKFIKMMED